MHIAVLIPLTLFLAACARPGARIEAPSTTADVVAGPRKVLEAPPAPDPDVPGKGPAVAYHVALRKAFMPAFRSCIDGLSASAARDALLSLRVDEGGELVRMTLVRPSGSRDFDDCAVAAIRSAELPPPPPPLLDDARQYATPPLAFVREPG